MKKMRYLLSSVLLIMSQFAMATDSFSLYLVRHAEKQKSTDKNPTLTECGQQRAQQLAKMLANIPLAQIYSTDYLRTQLTAKPTAEQKGLTVVSYDPRQLPQLANQLLDKKESALIVGHSNTTNVLASLLTNTEIAELDESEYDKLFQVMITSTGVTLNTFHQGFNCTSVIQE